MLTVDLRETTTGISGSLKVVAFTNYLGEDIVGFVSFLVLLFRLSNMIWLQFKSIVFVSLCGFFGSRFIEL